MAIFVDAQTDAADLASLVNENGLFTTRYGDNPKKSWLYMQDEFDTLLAGFTTDGNNAIDDLNVFIDAAKVDIANDVTEVDDAKVFAIANITSDLNAFDVYYQSAKDSLDDDVAAFSTDSNAALADFAQNSADAFNEFDLALAQYKESRGFNNKGTFAAGFTYELPNDVGIDASGNPWIYNGALPFTVTAGTTPTSPTYTQVSYSVASQVSMNTSDTVQSFADSFALKIFQSPTDGGLTEIQTRTVNGSEVYEVRKTSDDSLAAIYSDKEGLSSINQNGTDNISDSSGVVQFYIDDGEYYVLYNSNEKGFKVGSFYDEYKADVQFTPPAVPPASSNMKLILRPYVDTGSGAALMNGFYVVTRKSRSRGGYVAIKVSDDVESVDEFNTGGNGNNRVNQVINIKDCYVCCSRVVDQSAGVALSGLSSSYIDTIWNYNNTGVAFEYHGKSSNQTIETRSRELYVVPEVTLEADPKEYIEYEVTGDCSIRFALTSGSTELCNIQVGRSGALFNLATISLKTSSSSPITYLDYSIKAPIKGSSYIVRITNNAFGTGGSALYVAGLNIGKLSDFDGLVDVTSGLIQQPQSYNGKANMYKRSNGANEFAARESGGKFFGTFHGGHANFIERLRVDSGANYDLQNQAAVPELLMTEHVTIHSQSIMTPDSGVCSYNYIAETFIYDGMDYTQYMIELRSGTPATLSDAYTHMCTTNDTFNRIYQPILHTYTADEEVLYGNQQTCYQYRDDGLSLVSYYTGLNMKDNTNNGGRVSYQSSFAKQYYGPIFGQSEGVEYSGGMYVTAKEYF